MQSGFTSRQAALNAISSTNATFTNGHQFKVWLNADTTSDLARQTDWPTPETSTLWHKYVEEYQPASNSIWGVVSEYIPVVWLSEYSPVSGSFVKILNYETGETQVVGSDGEKVGRLHLRYSLLKTGIYYAVIAENTDYLDVKFYGVGNTPFENSNS
jgi:hypothetical protein